MRRWRLRARCGACGLAIGLGRFGLDAQPGRQIGLAQAEGLVEEAAGLARQLCTALGRCQLQPGRFGACLGRVAFTRQPGPLQIQLRLQLDGLGPRGGRARVVTRTRPERNAHADREGLLPGLAGGTAVTRGGDRQFGVGARLRRRQGRHAFGHRGAVLQRQQLAVRVHVRCRSARLRLGDEIRRAGCERQAGRRHQRAQGLLGHDHGGLRLRHRRLGGSHGAIGLVLVGLCQIAGLEPFAHIGRDPLRVVELALCGGGIGTRALPVPPGLTHGGGHPQLGCGGAAFDSTAFGLRPVPGCARVRRAATGGSRGLLRIRVCRDCGSGGRSCRSPPPPRAQVSRTARLAAVPGLRPGVPPGPRVRVGAPMPLRRPGSASTLRASQWFGPMHPLRQCSVRMRRQGPAWRWRSFASERA